MIRPALLVTAEIAFLLVSNFANVSIFAQARFAAEPCRIRVVDQNNDWPVPLVELRTTHNVRFVTDNAGLIAFDLPELMNKETWLHIEGHGYSVKEDRFGYRGVRIVPKPGETITIKVRRELAAKRLGCITGGGLFAESQKLGDEKKWSEQGILGCDSVQTTVHNGKLFWSWGDTILPHYPLGRFHMIGATTQLKPLTSFEPPIKLRYDYFVGDEDVPRNVAKLPGEGPTWLGGYVSLPDKSGQSRLVATYSKIKPPLSTYERGLCVWNEQTSNFERFKILWATNEQESKPESEQIAGPMGHTVFQTDKSGKRWVLFGDPFPALKCEATFEAWSDPTKWQTLKPQESVPVLNSDKTIKPHRGAIAWNGHRKKWVAIFTQLFGDNSSLGELWYAESNEPTGPWKDAVKVVTHNKYTFYNPQLHPEFTSKDSPILLFEATYTHSFSKTKETTPRHDYNQVLYRLDLDKMFDADWERK